MPTSTQLFAFGLLSALVIAVPGPSVTFAISRSLMLGRRAGVLTVVGNSAGIYLQVIAVAFGIGALVEQSVAAFTVIKLAGAGYLVYLGIQAFRHRSSLAATLQARAESGHSRRILRDGFLVGATNPKSVVFLTAVLPQFVNRSAGDVPLQLLVLGVVFVSIALVGDSVWAMAAGTARSWFARSPRRLELIGGVGGLTMISIGIGLAFTGRKT